jgi:acetyl esterase/lipase
VKFISGMEMGVNETDVAVIAAGRYDRSNGGPKSFGQSTITAHLQERQVSADSSRDHLAPGPQDARRLGQCLGTLAPLYEVIERPQKQRHVDALIRMAQVPGVAYFDGDTVVRSSRLHMSWHEVDDMHRMAVCGEPCRVDAGAAADVEYPGLRSRHPSPDQLLRSQILQTPVRGPTQPRALEAAIDVVLHQLCRHGAIVITTGHSRHQFHGQIGDRGRRASTPGGLGHPSCKHQVGLDRGGLVLPSAPGLPEDVAGPQMFCAGTPERQDASPIVHSASFVDHGRVIGRDPRRQFMTACRESSMVYEAADGTELPLLVFEPAEGTRLAAGIVLFHGGALRTGSADGLAPHCRQLALRGIFAASAGYRLLGQGAASIDDCVADVRRAIGHFRSQAALRGLETSCLASGGSSAGAHLALVAAMIAPGRPGRAIEPGVAAVVALNPAGLDLLAFSPQLQCSVEQAAGIAPGRASEYSLMEFVGPGNPPVLIHHGTDDEVEPIDHVRRFRDAMVRAGSECALIEYEHAEHGFHYPGHSGHFVDVIDATTRFLLDRMTAN